MEGVLSFPPEPPRRQPEQICAECGRSFPAHMASAGVEELCNTCYQAQFEPRRVHHWQKVMKTRRML